MASDEKTKKAKPDEVMYLPGKMICFECGIVLDLKCIKWEATSKWGYERPFCSSCVSVCGRCHETYVRAMEYQHQDCEKSSESESDESSQSESESDDEITIHPSGGKH